jgi:type IV secretion system protein VirB4
MLGSWHLAFCSILNFPHDSRANLLMRLDHLPFAHRQMTRWIAWPLTMSRKLFRQTENAWVSKQQSPLAHFMATQGFPSEVQDSHARNQAEDADAASQEVSGQFVGYGHFTSTVMAWGDTPAEAKHRIDRVREVFEDEDFTVIMEDEHSLDAFLSMLPGDVLHSARRYPISTLNLAHLEPSLKAYWPGPVGDAHLKAGPWFLAHTEGTSLFRVVNHVQDVGHFALLGPTGAGKSSMLGVMASSWLMAYGHLRARVVCLDIGRAMRALTLCLGGRYDDVSTGTVAFQPFAGVDDPAVRRRRLAWVLDGLEAQRVPRTTITEGALRESLEALARLPRAQRTWEGLIQALAERARIAARGIGASLSGDERGFATKLAVKQEVMGQYRAVQAALDNLGASGLFSGSETTVATPPRLHVIELGTLLDDAPLAAALLPYLNQEIRATFTGAPVLYVQDEHALQVTMPKQEDEAKRDLRSLRKANVSLGIATHDLVDLFDTQMGTLIINSCKTRFLLPNPAAQEEEVAQTYRRLGCTDTEISLLASLQPQGEYYLQQYEGHRPRRRTFALPLTGLWLACCGSSSAQDHEQMNQLLAQGHQPGPDFAAAWLEVKARQWQDRALMDEARALREASAQAAD